MPIISPNIRVRHPEHFQVGDESIVDDFCYFSTRIRVGRGSHIASGCSVAGGPTHEFTLGDYSSLSSGVKVWCVSDDFTNDLVTIVPAAAGAAVDVKIHLIEGDVHMGHFTAVGANAVVMPDNSIPEGTVIGALSFVPPRFPFEPWAVYAGVPIRRLGRRNREQVIAQVRQLDRALGIARG
jgi:acetyltransferase-like isoleucine patch superfamily enzyme